MSPPEARLYTRNDATVRMVIHNDAEHGRFALVVDGPRDERKVETFRNVGALMDARTEYERYLLGRGYGVMAGTSDRRRTADRRAVARGGGERRRVRRDEV
jgi:hypothetical protein